jgi:asparagine synthase (glutamine-hydrolysing)
MASADGSAIVVYNGEIYNFLELRSELVRLGARFRSEGDTEVLLGAYERWGEDALARFNGMWAFALWDGRRHRLLVARDRFGVKPLYYTTVGDTWIFASEIKALFEFPGVERASDDDQVLKFLRRTTDADDTMFRNVRAVPAGSLLTLERGRLSEARFWTLPRPATTVRSDADLVAEFQALLADSVRLRMRADVPIGTMLSGGLDSSAIAALVQRNQTARLPTFSACWPDSPVMDEESAIRLLAGQLALDSRVIYPSAEAVRDLLPSVTRQLEQPFVTPVAAVQYMLMREARRQGIKVVLNGHGSDEMLGGYPRTVLPAYLADLLITGQLRRYRHERRLFGSEARGGAVALVGALVRSAVSDSSWTRVVRRFGRLEDRGSALARIPVARERPDGASAASVDGMSGFDRVLWRMFSRYLPLWLQMEDRMSLAHSVESRLPFLDYRLVEFVFQLPLALKIGDGYTKVILRRAMRSFVPDVILDRRRKQPFAVPLASWLRGPWRDLVGDLLLSTKPRVARFLDERAFRAKLDAHLRSDRDVMDSWLLWRVLHTEMWMRGFAL